MILIHHPDPLVTKAALFLDGDEHASGTLELIEELGVETLRRGTHVDGIVWSSLLVAFPAVAADELGSTFLQQRSSVLALGHVVRRESDERLDVVDPDHFPARLDSVCVGGAGDEVGEDMGEVAGAGADIEDASGGVEEGEERFAG